MRKLAAIAGLGVLLLGACQNGLERGHAALNPARTCTVNGVQTMIPEGPPSQIQGDTGFGQDHGVVPTRHIISLEAPHYCGGTHSRTGNTCDLSLESCGPVAGVLAGPIRATYQARNVVSSLVCRTNATASP